MTPEDQQALSVHAREIAKILYRNAPPAAIDTLEGIEKTVRGQLLDPVSPAIALSLLRPKPDASVASLGIASKLTLIHPSIMQRHCGLPFRLGFA